MQISINARVLQLQETVGETPSSFYVIANAACPILTSFIDIAVAIKCFGVATSYLIVIGDLMPDALAEMGVQTTRQLWVTMGMGIVGPLSCLKTLDALKVTSTASLVFVGQSLIGS